jgi:hypothetical protein
MSSTTRIPQAEITGPYGYVLKRFSRKMLGEVPDALGVMWHNRAVLGSSMGFGRKVQKWDQLDPNLQTFAHMAVASKIATSLSSRAQECAGLTDPPARPTELDYRF